MTIENSDSFLFRRLNTRDFISKSHLKLVFGFPVHFLSKISHTLESKTTRKLRFQSLQIILFSWLLMQCLSFSNLLDKYLTRKINGTKLHHTDAKLQALEMLHAKKTLLSVKIKKFTLFSHSKLYLVSSSCFAVAIERSWLKPFISTSRYDRRPSSFYPHTILLVRMNSWSSEWIADTQWTSWKEDRVLT